MTSVGVYEAKTHFSQLIARVQAGETIEITRHGRAVALIVAPDPEPRPDLREVLSAMDEFRVGRHATVAEILEWRDEGRR
jgi:prevent-host-death family protein